jgi:hypothetical protein
VVVRLSNTCSAPGLIMCSAAGADANSWAASVKLCVHRQCKLLIAQVFSKTRASTSGVSWLQSDC